MMALQMRPLWRFYQFTSPDQEQQFDSCYAVGTVQSCRLWALAGARQADHLPHSHNFDGCPPTPSVGVGFRHIELPPPLLPSVSPAAVEAPSRPPPKPAARPAPRPVPRERPQETIGLPPGTQIIGPR